MALPCGQVRGSFIAAHMARSTSSEITPSQDSASAWTLSQGSPSTSDRNRSESRCRRTITSARRRPSAVRRISGSVSIKPSASSLRTISLTDGRLTPSHSAIRAWMTGMPSSSISQIAPTYSRWVAR
jgi:hypothetical protein